MPVFSYIAYPTPGAKDQLCKALQALEGCEVIPSENQDLLVLVTDTPDDSQEKRLQQKLKDIQSLQSLGMTFGHGDV